MRAKKSGKKLFYEKLHHAPGRRLQSYFEQVCTRKTRRIPVGDSYFECFLFYSNEIFLYGTGTGLSPQKKNSFRNLAGLHLQNWNKIARNRLFVLVT